MRLHLGSGGIYKQGYINIDIYTKEGKVDRVFDLSQPLDYPNESVEIIEAYHLFEHLPFPNIPEVVKSWYRVLIKGGRLIMEMPNLDEIIKGLRENPNDTNLLMCVFGEQDRFGQEHRWGWNKTRLKILLEGVGFKNVKFPPPQDYHRNLDPCLRVEAIK